MGRIKTKLIKRVSQRLFSRHMNEFMVDFDNNKKLVSQFTDVRSKKLRNIIAGYMTRLVKTKEEI